MSMGAQHYRLNLQPIVSDSLCVVEDSAYLYFPLNHEVFAPFYNKLNNHLRHGSGRINILHIGGSHVQAGYLSGRIRSNLISMRDSASHAHSKAADRGCVFPFRAIGTNAPANYSISYEGRWTASKCISPSPGATLGLSGAAAITNGVEASLTLSFSDQTWEFEQLRVLGYGSSEAVYPVVVIENDTIFPSLKDNKTGFLFHLPALLTHCKVSFCGLGEGDSFTLRGMIPTSKRRGITYTESGINGAAVPSWLKCEAFGEELSLIEPDLVIFGIGINDAATSYDSFDPEVFKANYRQLCDIILGVNPKAAFIFLTNNDCYQSMKVRRFNQNTERVEVAFKELAREYNGCVFNVFRTMGGPYSAANWVRNGLMQSDRVHFTREGYHLVADLLYNALVRDFTAFRAHPKQKNLPPALPPKKTASYEDFDI